MSAVTREVLDAIRDKRIRYADHELFRTFRPWERTPAEIAAVSLANPDGVFPVNYAYQPGNVRRYGAFGDGVADDTVAIQNAIDVAAQTVAAYGIGSTVYFPRGQYKITATLLMATGVSFLGDGYLSSTIKTAAAIVMLDYTPVSVTEGGIFVAHISIVGDASTTLDLIQLGPATWLYFFKVRLRETAGSCVHFVAQSIEVGFGGCVFESFANYGLELGALCSLLQVSRAQVNANAVTGLAFIGATSSASGGQMKFDLVNVNGNNKIANFLRVNNGSAIAETRIDCSYAEGLTGSPIVALGTGTIKRLRSELCNMLGANSIQIDLSNGALHEDIVITSWRSAMNANTFFHPGSTVNFTCEDISVDGGTKVFGFTGANSIKKYANGCTVLEGNKFRFPVLAPNGDATNPGHSFENDEDTGWFRNGANTLSASCGDLETLRLDAAGGLYIRDGITAPSTAVGYAITYVDTADGNYKVRFGDGTTRTITPDFAVETVTGAKAGNAALTDLIAKLVNLGLIADGTT